MPFRPMLAAKFDERKQRYPVLASPKLDGIRAIVIEGRVLSRSMKPIPNEYVQSLFGRPEFNGLDGELIVCSPTAPNVMQVTMSGVMSRGGQPVAYFHVFDDISTSGRYTTRLAAVAERTFDKNWVRCVRHAHLPDYAALLSYEQSCLSQGYEGVILRDPAAWYKQGRSTVKEGGMLKLKRLTDSEAEILDFIELQHNSNEAARDERGYTKRSHAQEGMVPMGMLGALLVRDLVTGQEFEIGTGFTEAQRLALWQDRPTAQSMYVKYRYFAYGVKDKPRQPVFLGFRSPIDL